MQNVYSRTVDIGFQLTHDCELTPEIISNIENLFKPIRNFRSFINYF